jgi:hypothetical protein
MLMVSKLSLRVLRLPGCCCGARFVFFFIFYFYYYYIIFLWSLPTLRFMFSVSGNASIFWFICCFHAFYYYYYYYHFLLFIYLFMYCYLSVFTTNRQHCHHGPRVPRLHNACKFCCNWPALPHRQGMVDPQSFFQRIHVLPRSANFGAELDGPSLWRYQPFKVQFLLSCRGGKRSDSSLSPLVW